MARAIVQPLQTHFCRTEALFSCWRFTRWFVSFSFSLSFYSSGVHFVQPSWKISFLRFFSTPLCCSVFLLCSLVFPPRIFYEILSGCLLSDLYAQIFWYVDVPRVPLAVLLIRKGSFSSFFSSMVNWSPSKMPLITVRAFRYHGVR